MAEKKKEKLIKNDADLMALIVVIAFVVSLISPFFCYFMGWY